MKIVINTCWGGFGISELAIERYIEMKGLSLFSEVVSDRKSYYYVPVEEYKKALVEDEKNKRGYPSNKLAWSQSNIKRDDDVLIKVIEELQEKANGSYSKLKIVEIPDNVNYVIKEYDGCEHIAEVHRTWC